MTAYLAGLTLSPCARVCVRAAFSSAFTLLLAGCFARMTNQDPVAKDRNPATVFYERQAQFDRHEVSGAQYSADLGRLRLCEEQFFKEARTLNLSDRQAGNYFFRSQLKFSSPIETALKRLSEEKIP